MNETDFITWLKGFTEGVHTYSIGPKQWQFLKEKLEKVNLQESKRYRLTEGWVTTTTAEIN